MSAKDEFELAVATETDRLWGLAYSIIQDAAEAEDAVQDTMERAWRAWRSVRDARSLEAWLTRVCINRALDLKRRRGSRHRLLEWLRQAGDGYDEDRGAMDLDRLYLRLTRQQRAVLVLHYRHGYSLDECAVLMRCRPGTVRSHLARALAGLRRGFDDD